MDDDEADEEANVETGETPPVGDESTAPDEVYTPSVGELERRVAA